MPGPSNEEKIAVTMREYHQTKMKNEKRKRAANMRKYREKNKEKIAAYQKQYYQTPAGRKSSRLNNWKRSGVISDDFSSLYEYYLNCKNCEECNIPLTEDRVRTATTRCLDHCHTTGEFRNVLCQGCNRRRG